MNYVTVADTDKPHATRNNPYFSLNRFRTEIRKKAIAIYGPKTWNDLPTPIQNCKNIVEFEKMLKQHMMLGYDN